MTELSILLFAAYGFTLLALSLTRHQQEVTGRRLTPRQVLRLRIGGAAVLALGLALALRTWGFGYGLVMALGLASVGAALVVGGLCLLRWREGKR